MLQLGQEEPVMSMDGSGNVVWVDNHEIIFSNVRSMGSNIDLQDGETLSLQQKGICVNLESCLLNVLVSISSVVSSTKGVGVNFECCLQHDCELRVLSLHHKGVGVSFGYWCWLRVLSLQLKGVGVSFRYCFLNILKCWCQLRAMSVQRKVLVSASGLVSS